MNLTEPEQPIEERRFDSALERATAIFQSRCPVLIGAYVDQFGVDGNGIEWLFNHTALIDESDEYSVDLFFTGRGPSLPVPAFVWKPAVDDVANILHDNAEQIAKTCAAELQRMREMYE